MTPLRTSSSLRPWHLVLVIGALLISTGVVVLARLPGSLAEVGVDSASRAVLIQADPCAKHLLSAADHTLSATRKLGRLNALLGAILLALAWYWRREPRPS